MPVAVISVAQMRAWEQATWDTGQSVERVMRLAGRAVANAALAMNHGKAPVLILAGKGNNGGDARYAAEYLEGSQTTLVDCSDETVSTATIRDMLDHVTASGGLVIDGLFGIGLNRAPAGRWAEIIDAVNARGPRILAVDVPSGLDSEGASVAGAVIRADHTLTFGAPKLGLLSAMAAPYVGRLEVATDIGLVPCPFKQPIEWILDSDFRDFPPRRQAGGHKGTFGHLAILAGSTGYHGAAVLAALAAQRAMPGLISVYPSERVYPSVAAQLRQSMVHPWSDQTRLPRNCTALLVGPGLAGPDVSGETIAQIRELWARSPMPIVADASALDWIPPGDPISAVRIVTPHPGEAARLLGVSVTEIQAERVAAAQAISKRLGNCHVVLKGNRTVIVNPGHPTAVNGTGNPNLGQGGSGDLLAGHLAGLVAQASLASRIAETIRHAVHEHGRAADFLTGRQSAWDLDDFVRVLGTREISRHC